MLMISGAEIGLGVKVLKSALDIVKEAKDLTDTAAIKSKLIDMQSLILEAQGNAIEARSAHEEQANRIRDLESEISQFKSWQHERERYELMQLGDGTFAYMLKLAERGNQPPHWLCPNCFEDGKKSLFQRKSEMYLNAHCPRCKAEIAPEAKPSWL
jgi:hypothetical protein